MEKCKSYSRIKRNLKDQKIHSQTTITKLRIHWEDGAKIYNNAEEASMDMRRRGLDIQDKNGTGSSLKEKVKRHCHGSTLGRIRGQMAGPPLQRTLARTRWKKLQEFKR